MNKIIEKKIIKNKEIYLLNILLEKEMITEQEYREIKKYL